MGCLDDIQTTLKLKKKKEKIEINFMTILGLIDLFKTMNPSGLTRTEISNSDLSEYTLFQIQKYFFTHKNQCLSEK